MEGTRNRNSPPANSINLGEGQTAKQIAAGYYHTCAIVNDNSSKCWGYNGYGQLGYGNHINRNSPPADSINLGAGVFAKQIVASNSHTCAILNDNSVKCWGNNRYGRLGYGDIDIRNAPPVETIDMGAGRSTKRVAAGEYHTCAIASDDSIECWGRDNFGQLGYGN